MRRGWQALQSVVGSVQGRVAGSTGSSAAGGTARSSTAASSSTRTACSDAKWFQGLQPLQGVSKAAHQGAARSALPESYDFRRSGRPSLGWYWGSALCGLVGTTGGFAIGNIYAKGLHLPLENLDVSALLPSWAVRAAESVQLPPAPAPVYGPHITPYFIADAAAAAAPAVVNITMQVNGFPFQGASSGSGFILEPDGTILTNAHVVAEAITARQPYGSAGQVPPIMVTLQDGRIFEGQLVSYDRVSDLAVVKIEAEEALPVARLGSSSGLRVGEWVVALGSPLHLSNTVTAGIISCTDRKAVELGLASARTDYIQTDASINAGNSGGPLVNLRGEVIGISNLKAVAADGVSFAIPIATAVEVVEQLKQHGRVIRPYIGIKMLQLNASVAAQLRRRDPAFPSVSAGILVPHVTPGSPAQKAGLRPGDIIIGAAGVGGAALTTAGLIKALGEHVGRGLELQVQRPAGRVTLSVAAAEAAP